MISVVSCPRGPGSSDSKAAREVRAREKERERERERETRWMGGRLRREKNNNEHRGSGALQDTIVGEGVIAPRPRRALLMCSPTRLVLYYFAAKSNNITIRLIRLYKLGFAFERSFS